ncbi:RsiG family protein [Nocardioides sp. AX2bis]|uniref:RsiG family protein n=1 Tax=Nocardioides sp. AX2bis TaxID=2653157 RepID=UPI0012F36DD4|nr:hypothetical protein [Nocardioides sp. AX2bis]VXC59076.1 conserved hypothetical protein [Nocardioides sp. AX2bis]
MNDQTATGPGTLDVGEAPRLDDLALPGLRAYRQRLRDEEDRASYWRRVVHARLDLIEAGGTGTGAAVAIGLEDLVRVLGDTATGAGRTALLRVRAADPLPELPDLAEVWAPPTTPAETTVVVERLRAAERQLTAYRSALFARLDESTAALIARYRSDPSAALSVLEQGAA